MRCHFLISNVFKLGQAGWYCITKGNILLHASLFFCLSDAFLSLNLTPERCFSTTLVGYPLFRGRFSIFFIFSSKVNCEEFVLRSLNASPLIKPGAWWVTRVKIHVLKILSRFVVWLHIKDRFFVESCTFVHFCVQVLACLYQRDILIIKFTSFLDLECT